LSSTSLDGVKREEFVTVDDVAALEELSVHEVYEEAFDSLSNLRSELFKRPHLPNEEDTSIITSMIADLNEETLHLAHDLCNTLTECLSRSGGPHANLHTPLRMFTRKYALVRMGETLKAGRYVKTAIKFYRASASDFSVDYLLEPIIQHALLGFLVEDVFCHFIPAADCIHPSFAVTFNDPVAVLYQRLQSANRRLAGTWRAVAYLAATESRNLSSLVQTKSSARLEQLHRAFKSFQSRTPSGLLLDELMTTFSSRLQKLYRSAWAIHDKIRTAYIDIDFSIFMPATGKPVDHRSMRLAPEHHTCPNKRCTVSLSIRVGLRASRRRVTTGVTITEDIVFLKPDVLCVHIILNN